MVVNIQRLRGKEKTNEQQKTVHHCLKNRWRMKGWKYQNPGGLLEKQPLTGILLLA